MTDVVERIARGLCEKRGVDPDELHDFGNGQLMAWALVAEEVEWTLDALAESITPAMGVALERALSEGDGGRDLSGNYKLRAIRAAILAAKG